MHWSSEANMWEVNEEDLSLHAQEKHVKRLCAWCLCGDL